MATETLRKDYPEGFEGAIAGLTLSDVIQLKGINRFSGCISVEYGNRLGYIFFRDGEIIHSEQNGESGADAFYEIMRWPSGSFKVQPKVTTTNNTIQDNWRFLILEAHRLMDELPDKAKTGPSPSAVKTDTGSEARTTSTISAKLKQIPGVEHAVLMGKDGIPTSDRSLEGETLAAQGTFLALTADRLGGFFGAGNLKSAAVQGEVRQLLLFESRQQYLSVAVKPDSRLDAVEAEIKKALVPNK